MGTTDAARQSRSSAVTGAGGAGSPIRLGILWGYPFSLVRRLLLVFVALLAFIFASAYILSSPTDPVDVLIHLVPVAIAIFFSLYVAELVGVTERPLPPLTLEALFWAIATSCLAMAVGYALVPTYAPSTMLVCSAPVASAVAVYLQRKWIEAKPATEDAVPSMLVAADRAGATQGMVDLAALPLVKVVGIIMPARVKDRAPMAGVPVLLPKAGLQHGDRDGVQLYVTAGANEEALRGLLAERVGRGCTVERVDRLAAKTQGRVVVGDGDDVRLVRRLTEAAERFALQRAFDVLFAAMVAVPALVMGPFVALAIRLTSKGPILYRQIRVGRFGREFEILKFRTMRVDAEKETGPVWAQANDPRITPIGGFLRKTRLDEFPQLWNVLRGDMSLVGPRPERPMFVDELRTKIPLYDTRHSVRPGLTGWAQIRYPYGSTDKDAEAKLTYELFYILHRSATFYFTCLLETVKVLIFRRGAR